MYADNFGSHHIRPVPLAASLLISGIVVTGMIFVAPRIDPRVADRALETFNVREAPPPPPVETERKPKHQVARDTHVTAPPRRVERDATGPGLDTVIDLKGSGWADPGPDLGSGAGAGPAEPPPPPALVDARIDPRFADDFQPAYPASEVRADREGRVSVRVLIGVDGRVKAIESLGATSPAFFEATRRQALGRWRFKPATRGGVPVESWKVMSVRFQLSE